MKEFRVSITSGTLLTALAIILGAYILWLLRDIFLLVVTAIVIASAIEPGVAFFIRYHIPRFLAALLVYALVFGSVFALLFLFFPPIIADAANFFAQIPEYVETLNLPSGSISAFDTSAVEESSSFLDTLIVFKDVFTAGSTGIFQLVTTFFGGIFSLLLVIVLSFYFALQDTGVEEFLRLILPISHEEYAVNLWRRAQKKIGLWMQGQVLLSVIVGILTYLGLLIIGVPYALLLAVLTGAAEIIPVFGSLIAGVVAIAVGYSEGGFALAAIVAGLYVVVNQFEANLIYPLIVKKIVGIPPLLVIVALIAGYTLAGFLGVLLSVPIAAVVLEFMYDLDKRKRRSQAHSQEA